MLWSEINTIVSDLTDANTTDFPTATRVIYANASQEEVTGEIIKADGRWQWDDTNQTTLPIGTADLVSGQQDYGFESSFLEILRVSAQDASGTFHKLKAIDEQDVDIALSEYQSANGQPKEYDKIGDSVFLYPIPSYNATDGLKVHFQRSVVKIASFDSTTPGFALNHIVIAYMIAIPYCAKYKRDRVAGFEREKLRLMDTIIKHYSRRAKDDKPRLVAGNHSNK